jgi:DNA-binding transcriptional LysR family regulator
MADLALLTCFVRAAEHGSFSAAARRLGVSAAAVSKNVAHLEAHVGVRLFHRSTRRLALTGGGERLLAQVRDPLASLDAAIASLRDDSDEPSGTLKVSMGQALGRQFLVPLLNEFLDRCPAVVPDWHFDDRRIDLVGEGFDAAVGGGFELAPGLVARELAPVHIVAVAAPAYLAGRPRPQQPADFAELAGIMRRSTPSGRVRPWTLRPRRGVEQPVPCRPRLSLSDPEAISLAARQGLGRGAWCPCRSRSRTSPPASSSGCCPAGTATPARCRSTTRRAAWCPPRRAPSSTSSSNASGPAASRAWSTRACSGQAGACLHCAALDNDHPRCP